MACGAAAPTATPVPPTPEPTATATPLPTPTPTATPAPTPTPLPSISFLHGLPSSEAVMHMDLKQMRATPGLRVAGDEMAFSFLSTGNPDATAKALIESIDAVTFSLDPFIIMFEGRFQDLRGPLIQAGFAAASTAKQTHRDTVLYNLGGVIQGLPSNSVWLIAADFETTKLAVDVVLDKPASADARRLAGLKRIGPGYVLFTGAPKAFEDEENAASFGLLKGLAYGGWSLSVADAADTRVRGFLQFDSVANATAAEAELRQPGRVGKALDLTGTSIPTFERAGDTVSFEALVSHASVLAMIRE